MSEETIHTYLYSNCTFHQQIEQRVQTSFTVPTNLGKDLANIIYCTCFCQHAGKQDRIHARTNMGKGSLHKFCWYSVWLCGVGGVGGVGGEVSGETIQTYPYSHCTFHHQNSQRVQASSTLPTNLGKALANIIHCTCFFQHVASQNRTRARTNMGKISLHKLLLVFCVVAWCWWGWW